MSENKPPLTYQQAGVDIAAGNALVEKIKPIAARTNRTGLLGGLGGFGAFFQVPTDRYQQPVLVSSTDGVGTKLKLALELGQHQTIGIDLVAMCVNDIITSGAEPLFFLDYYATGHLDVSIAEQVIAGIGHGCELAGAALVGGETAEMPSVYQGQDYDLAGFCVGVVEKQKIIDGRQVQVGDVLIGLASSGVHANGFSLVRKVLELTQTTLDTPFENQTLGEILLQPTKIYAKPLLELMQVLPIHALAHITGGGLVENIPRVLPPGFCAKIDSTCWQPPAIFQWLQTQGNIAEAEMYRTFNLGVGMVVCVGEENANTALELLQASGETAWPIGEVVANPQNTVIFGDD